jgi:hypothetical protein
VTLNGILPAQKSGGSLIGKRSKTERQQSIKEAWTLMIVFSGFKYKEIEEI